MKKSTIGSLAIILGSALLSLQLYGLNFIQGMHMMKGSWRTNAIDYAKEQPIGLALFISCGIVVYGIVMVILEMYEKKRDS